MSSLPSTQHQLGAPLRKRVRKGRRSAGQRGGEGAQTEASPLLTDPPGDRELLRLPAQRDEPVGAALRARAQGAGGLPAHHPNPNPNPHPYPNPNLREQLEGLRAVLEEERAVEVQKLRSELDFAKAQVENKHWKAEKAELLVQIDDLNSQLRAAKKEAAAAVASETAGWIWRRWR